MTTPTPNALTGFSESLAGAVAHAAQATVSVNARHRLAATGILWRTGVVVTADHAVERDDEITVTLPDGTTVPATLAGRDPSTDLAVLKVDGVTLAPADIGDTNSLKVGHMVLALGFAGGTLGASSGVISAINSGRTGRGTQIENIVRPDLTLYPGFSGGPLVNTQGQVVGLNTSHLSRAGGVALPTATINAVVDQLLSKGKIARGYLGISMQPVRISDATKAALNLTENGGLIVIAVEAGAPAEQGGVLVGDVLIGLEGTAVSDTNDVQTLLGPDKVNQPVTLRVIRGGADTTLTVTVGERA
jgi:S1-C subfamily serine protease